MGFGACLFVAQLEDEESRPLLETRAGWLPDFYRGVPWGDDPDLHLSGVPQARAVVGAVRLDREWGFAESLLTWGGPLPESLSAPAALSTAGDSELRSLDGIVVAVAAHAGQVHIVTGAGGVTELYFARSRVASVWATHAAAAGLLAFGRPAIEPAGIPELIALEYVGGNRTMVRDVQTVPTASRIELTQAGSSVRSYWPARERWQPMPEGEAHDHAEEHLLQSLKRRVSGPASVACGLTAGLDSRVAAVALRELGVEFDTFTVGRESEPDVSVAREVAATIKASHRRHEVSWLEEEAAFDLFDLTARLGDGMRGMTLAAEQWPIDIEVLVSGSGAEIGRGFYYPPVAAAHPHPGSRILRTVVNGARARLGPVRPEVAEALGASIDSWLAEAQDLGHSGWRALDVVYAEQRWRRWYRAQIAPVRTLLVPVFATPEVGRGLASLPLRDRLSNGFNRRFLSRRAPQLAPAGPGGPSAPALAAMRARRAASFVARPARAIRGNRRRSAPSQWPGGARWEAVPEVRRWLAEDVLGSPLIAETMGDLWVQRTRDGFLGNEAIATEATLSVAAPVLLQRALDEAGADDRSATAGPRAASGSIETTRRS